MCVCVFVSARTSNIFDEPITLQFLKGIINLTHGQRQVSTWSEIFETELEIDRAQTNEIPAFSHTPSISKFSHSLALTTLMYIYFRFLLLIFNGNGKA